MLWGWVGAVVAVAAVIAGGTALANATVLSASQFARDYLDALRSDRIDEVLALPGIAEALIGPDALDASLFTASPGERFEFEIVGDEVSDGVHGIRVAFGSERLEHHTTLLIEQQGTRFGVFPRWGFATAPVTNLTVELAGDSRFTIGGQLIDAEGAEAVVTVLRPGLYTLDHQSEFLEARATEIAAEKRTQDAEFEVEANDHFVDTVRGALEKLLDTCATQTVLFPVGCPFGTSVVDRVVGEPEWAIGELPRITIEPGDRIGLWRVARFEGTAELTVEVQDLYDGALDTEQLDVPFESGYDITFDGSTVVLLPR